MTTGMKLLKANKSGSVSPMGKNINRTPINKDSVYAMTADNDKMVTGIFKNIETPGQPAFVCMRLYKGQQPYIQNMKDGEAYTIPLSVAREINKICKYPVDKHILDENGEYVKTAGTPRERYQFVSTDYQ